MRINRNALSWAMISVMIVSLLIPVAFADELNNESPKYKEGVIIVQFEPTSKAEEKAQIRTEQGLSIAKNLKKKGLELVKINGHKSVEEVIDRLNKRKGVVFAEPDYLLYPSFIPNDTYYDLLWGMENSKDNDINASSAWDIQMGSGVVVAVIDTGVQTSHPDLTGQFVAGYDFYNNDSSVYDGPDDDHGTHVSGTIAAIANNNEGVIGVAPEVLIMPLKFLGPDGGSTSDAILAINYASANGADVINASWGGGGYSEALKTAIEDFGGPFVAAAGNSRMDTDRFAHYPSSYDSSNIISVAAIDSKGRLARFSNYGDVTVDVGAPGVDIASTYPGGYAYMSGTSMAAPHVTGIAALMLAEDSNLTTTELISVMFDTVKPLDSLNGKTLTGGLVNAQSALDALNGSPEPGNTAPVVTISEPTDQTTVQEGTIVTFTGSASDAEEGNLSSQINWSSDIDGNLGTGSSVNYTLSTGTHTVMATVTDAGGLTSEDSITVIVESITPPPVGELSSDVVYSYWHHPKKDYGSVEASVTVTDGQNLVSGATVVGDWIYNGTIEASESGVTSDNGIVIFSKSKVTDPEGYTFDVTSLTP